MKHLKKWTALLLALMLMITLVPWTAKAEFTQPTGTIKVMGVEDGATVKAYRLTKAVFDANGNFLRYENVVAGAFAKPQEPTNADWSELIKKPVGDLVDAITLDGDAANGYTVAGQEAGLYMILVTSTKGVVYNPIIIGLSYVKDAKGERVEGGEIKIGEGIGKNFNLDTKGDLLVNLYAKKSEVPLKKTVKDPTPETEATNPTDHAIGLGKGEKPEFTIETTIPSYPTTDKNLVFTITDTLDKGLTAPKAEEITVTVDDAPLPQDAATVEVNKDTNVITITFKDAYLKELAGKATKVKVVYKAELNDQATTNAIPNKNTVKVTYTNDPKTGDTSEHEDITRQYTFEIDGFTKGSGSEKTHEITKHGDQITEKSSWTDDPLSGAEFTLYDKDPSKDNTAKALRKTTTDATGRMTFSQLDEGTYYIKETKAPNGYQLNEKVYTAVIKAEYDTAKHVLKSWSVVIDGKVSTFTLDHTKEEVTVTQTAEDNTLIKNTKIPGLPTTGGMGTYLFTGIGVALIAGALVLITVLKKKKPQAE